jgi:hypothetical protein
MSTEEIYNYRKVNDQFAVMLKQTIENFMVWNIHGLLNIYVDPSHVVDNIGFMQAMQQIHDLGISTLTYTQSLEIGNQDKAE